MIEQTDKPSNVPAEEAAPLPTELTASTALALWYELMQNGTVVSPLSNPKLVSFAVSHFLSRWVTHVLCVVRRLYSPSAIMDGQPLNAVDNLGFNFIHYAALEGNRGCLLPHSLTPSHSSTPSLRLAVFLVPSLLEVIRQAPQKRAHHSDTSTESRALFFFLPQSRSSTCSSRRDAAPTWWRRIVSRNPSPSALLLSPLFFLLSIIS